MQVRSLNKLKKKQWQKYNFVTTYKTTAIQTIERVSND